MSYRHPAARIHEIVQAPKALVAGQSVSPKKRGSHGLSFEAFGAFIRLEGAGRDKNPCSSGVKISLPNVTLW
jgi:hypothetical protein